MTALQEGNYVGRLTNAVVTFAGSGNPQMELRFMLLNGGEDTGTARVVYLPLTDAALDSWVDDTLATLGFNGDFNEPAFDDSVYQSCELWMKWETYGNKDREKWSISGGSRNPKADQSMTARLGAKWRARHGAKASPPADKPTPPSRPAPAAGPPARGGGAPVTPVLAKDHGSAWDHWVKSGCDDAGAFNRAIDEQEFARSIKSDQFTEADWAEVARKCPPSEGR